jgi:hypothetical protein
VEVEELPVRCWSVCQAAVGVPVRRKQVEAAEWELDSAAVKEEAEEEGQSAEPLHLYVESWVVKVVQKPHQNRCAVEEQALD